MIISQNRKYTIGFILIVVIILLSLFLFSIKTQVNPVTGKKQYINLTPKQEIELGLECAPDMAAKFGGLYANTEIQNRIKNIGQKLVAVKQVSKSPYQFDFHVLADSQMVNIFSFPGGQIFITKGLLTLLKTDDEIAAVLSHEIGHVIGRHTTEKLSGFNVLEEFKDSTNATNRYDSEQISKFITDLLKLTFDSEEEKEADELALKYLVGSGYKSNILPQILKNFDEKSEELNVTDFLNRHPISERRIENLENALKKDSKH